MNDPYKAPDSRVSDAPRAAAGPRPTPITVALVLLALLVVLKCREQFSYLEGVRNGEMSALAWLVNCFWIVAIVVCGWMIARGRNWARWVFFLVAMNLIYQYALSRLSMSGFGSTFDLSMYVVSLWLARLVPLLAVGVLFLVFVPGRGWFGRRAD